MGIVERMNINFVLAGGSGTERVLDINIAFPLKMVSPSSAGVTVEIFYF